MPDIEKSTQNGFDNALDSGGNRIQDILRGNAPTEDENGRNSISVNGKHGWTKRSKTPALIVVSFFLQSVWILTMCVERNGPMLPFFKQGQKRR